MCTIVMDMLAFKVFRKQNPDNLNYSEGTLTNVNCSSSKPTNKHLESVEYPPM